MAKSNFRKATAAAAAMALGVAGLTAQPAFAVTYLSTGLSAGVSYNTLTGVTNGLTLNTSISSLMSADENALKYRIVNPSEVDLVASAGNASVSTLVRGTTVGANQNAGWYEYGDTTTLLADGGSLAGYDQDDNDMVLDLEGTDIDGEYNANNLLKLVVADGTATDYSLTVTAWLDVDDDNTIDTTEIVAESVTVNFYDEDNVTATTSISRAVNGEAYVTAQTVLTPELNGNQLGASIVDVLVTAQGNAGSVYASDTFKADGTQGATTYSSTTKVYTSTAYLAYSKADEAWDGTDITVADLDLSATINTGTWFYHNGDDSTSGDVILELSSDSDTASNGEAHSVTSQSATHFVVVGADVDDANTAVLAAASVTFGTNKITLVTGVTASADVASDAASAISEGYLYKLKASSQATVTNGSYAASSVLRYASGSVEALTDAPSVGVTATSTYDTTMTVAGSDNFTYGEDDDASASTTNISVRKGYKGDIPVTVTVVNSVAAPVAGVSVNLELSAEGVNASVDGAAAFNGKVVPKVTDANGELTFTVSSADATTSEALTVIARPVGAPAAAAAELVFGWSGATYTLYDLNDPSNEEMRTADNGGSVAFNLAVVDQFGAILKSANHRLLVQASGRTVADTTHLLTNGAVSIAISDQGLGAGAVTNVDVDVQELSAGTWSTTLNLITEGTNGLADLDWASGDQRRVINWYKAQTDAVILNADGNNTAAGGDNGELDGVIGTTALFAADNRVTSADASGNGTAVVVSGKVVNATTLAARKGAQVTISGPSTILFQGDDSGANNGSVFAFGSASVIADENGRFTFNAYSNMLQDAVTLTVTSGGDSEEVIVDFTGHATFATSGKTLTISGPSYAAPGSTLELVATVADKFGNGVDTLYDLNADGDAGDAGESSTNFKVTYTGPGIVFNTLPTATDSLGQAKVQALLGTRDTGTITVTFSYDHDNDGSYADVGSLVVTKTVTVGTAPAAAADTKVNAGSFKGYVAIYAKGYEGKRLSAKVGNDWVVVPTLASNFERVVEFTGAGYTIAVRIYIDRVLVDTITVTTK